MWQDLTKSNNSGISTMTVKAIKTILRNLCSVALLALVMSNAALVVDAKVVFNEIMLNPLNPAHGQWFELHNTDTVPVSLQSWIVCTFIDGVDACFWFPSTAVIAANGYLTIGKNNAAGFLDYVWNDMLSFSPAGSSTHNGLELHYGGSRIDAVDWNVNSNDYTLRLPFPLQPGASLSRKNAELWTQDPNNWAPSTPFIDCLPGNDKGTPGERNDKTCQTLAPTLAPVSIPYSYNFYGPVILLNEIMLHPLHPANQGQ
jgi:Lamin Tail Domain